MAAYKYQAINTLGDTVQGVIDAESEKAARQGLRSQSLVPLNVKLVSADATPSAGSGFWSSRAFSQADLVVWTRQLASLVNAGLPLERALTALLDEAAEGMLRDLMSHIRAEVNAGSSLAHALRLFPREFDELYVAVISAGEQSGRLGQVLLQLAEDLESRHAMRSKLLAAALYPAIVSGVALCIVLFLLTYVVPQVAQVFEGTHRPLPWLTKAMLALSRLALDQGLGWLLGLMALTIIGGRWLQTQPEARRQWDAGWLQLPWVGRLIQGYHAARFASTLSLLVGAGVPMLRSLQTAAQTVTNMAMRADAMATIEQVREGAPLASALAQHKRLPSLLTMFVKLGEQTGQLPQMLQHAADHMSREVQRRSLQMATLLEPLLIVVMGLVVMLIVLSVMMPIIQLNQWVR
jgi:general secretion pathway protein F